MLQAQHLASSNPLPLLWWARSILCDELRLSVREQGQQLFGLIWTGRVDEFQDLA